MRPRLNASSANRLVRVSTISAVSLHLPSCVATCSFASASATIARVPPIRFARTVIGARWLSARASGSASSPQSATSRAASQSGSEAASAIRFSSRRSVAMASSTLATAAQSSSGSARAAVAGGSSPSITSSASKRSRSRGCRDVLRPRASARSIRRAWRTSPYSVSPTKRRSCAPTHFSLRNVVASRSVTNPQSMRVRCHSSSSSARRRPPLTTWAASCSSVIGYANNAR